MSIIRATAKILDISPKEVASRPLPEYYPVDLKYFKSVNEVGTDVFIRIKKAKTSN